MKSTLPDQLPATVAELDKLATDATAEIRVFQARKQAGDEFTVEDADRLDYLVASKNSIDEARTAAATSEQEFGDRLNSLLDSADKATAPAAPEAPAEAPAAAGATGATPAEVTAEAAAEVVAEAEQATAEAAQPVAAAPAPANFAANVTSDVPADTATGEAKGWELLPSAAKYGEFSGKVGTREIAESITSVKEGQAKNKTAVVTRGGKDFAVQPVAKLVRPGTGRVITDGNELLAELERIAPLNAGSARDARMKALTAAGGWTAPSEQVYTFCAVPPAVNLISLPEVDVDLTKRGGVRYPIESDMSTLLTDFAFQQHFTETELEAVDGGGEPTAIIDWNEIPAPDSFVEFRLGIIAYAVKVGILHQQGWPESVKHDIERLMVRHQHGISYRTISDMVSGSGSVKVVPTDSVLGATTGILNGLAWQAIYLRLDKGLDIDAPIEGVAPVWLKEVIRSDLALRDGLEALEVSDERINGFLTRRNIYLQYVDDWQTRSTGKPGHPDTMQPPSYADVLLYPAGAWFRSLNPVITFGVQYPMELLAKNQYSHGFFEDSIAVGKRCDKSINVRVPLCVNGAVGAREVIVCPSDTVTKTVTVTGSPSGGNYTLKFSANGIASATIAHNAAGSAMDTALTGIDDAVTGSGAITVVGDGPYTVTYPAKLGALQLGTNSLSGGSAPTVTIV